ncbi:MAG: GNAT family N-acetyltransferase [Oligoflexales bacterium]|nr:GNAT family N-acetyltransferase [Oligoflexales bacterium]
MQFYCDLSQEDITERNRLLSESLRPPQPLFPIESEYPIVLDKKNTKYSYCLKVNNVLVSHLNLWPRVLHDRDTSTSFKIGLVGNVATNPNFRGYGYMRRCFEHLEEVCRHSNIEAIILWSDLLKIYGNLGFDTLGTEFRVTYNLTSLGGLPSIGNFNFKQACKSAVTSKTLHKLAETRYKTEAFLERSMQEFKKLLNIPAMELFICTEGDKIQGYCIIGKGYDMTGVIHEWGAASPEVLMYGIKSMMKRLNLEDVMILIPGNISAQWLVPLIGYASSKETHPMALIKKISNNPSLDSALNKLFVWGLDSI